MNLGTQVLLVANQRGFPVIGVTLRDPTDPSTWTFQYRKTVTDEQRATAEAWKTSYVPAEDGDWRDGKERVAFDGAKMVKAVALWAAQRFGISAAQARAEILSLYRRLD